MLDANQAPKKHSSIASPNPESDYSDLAKVVQAWPSLLQELKAAIKAIVDTSS
jgi:hypothetical protein